MPDTVRNKQNIVKEKKIKRQLIKQGERKKNQQTRLRITLFCTMLSRRSPKRESKIKSKRRRKQKQKKITTEYIKIQLGKKKKLESETAVGITPTSALTPFSTASKNLSESEITFGSEEAKVATSLSVAMNMRSRSGS